MRSSMPSSQIKALAIAMAGATLAAVATMFVPTAMLEGFTGATGLSELVPAAAAPLGDTVRAMIAFAAGALVLAILAYFLLRQDGTTQIIRTAPEQVEEVSEAVSLKDRLAGIAWPKMPWAKGEDDITDLADLPKLRGGDAHPDAPPRRPLSAGQDLPILDLVETAPSADGDEVAPIDSFQPEIVKEAPLSEPKVTLTSHLDQGTEPSIPPPPLTPVDAEPTLAEMVAQLEAAVAERQQQLAELEAVAAALGAEQPAKQAPVDTVEVHPVPEPARFERPPLEAVPASVRDDDMDSALAAALATLHRMNGTDR